MRVLLAVAFGLLIASTAGAAPPDTAVHTRGTVRELGAGALDVVAVRTGCAAPQIWVVGRPRLQSLGSSPCRGRAEGRAGSYGLSFGSRATAWATYVRDRRGSTYSLWLSAPDENDPRRWPTGRRIALATRHGSTIAPILVGEGRHSFVLYAVDRNVYVERELLAGEKERDRRLVWTAPARPVALAGLAAVAVLRADGPVSVVSAGRIRTYRYRRGEALAVKAYGGRIVVLRRGALDVHDRSRSRSIPLPRAGSYGDGYCSAPRCRRAELRLEDVDRDYVLYVLGREIHVLRLSDRKDVVVREPAAGPVEAQLELIGLSYSSGSRVAFVPIREVYRLLRRS